MAHMARTSSKDPSCLEQSSQMWVILKLMGLFLAAMDYMAAPNT